MTISWSEKVRSILSWRLRYAKLNLQPQRKWAVKERERSFPLLSCRHLYLGSNLLSLGQCSYYAQTKCWSLHGSGRCLSCLRVNVKEWQESATDNAMLGDVRQQIISHILPLPQARHIDLSVFTSLSPYLLFPLSPYNNPSSPLTAIFLCLIIFNYHFSTVWLIHASPDLSLCLICNGTIFLHSFFSSDRLHCAYWTSDLTPQGVTKPTNHHSLQLCGCCQLLSRQCRSCVAISSYIWLLGLWQLCLLPDRAYPFHSNWLVAHSNALIGCNIWEGGVSSCDSKDRMLSMSQLHKVFVYPFFYYSFLFYLSPLNFSCSQALLTRAKVWVEACFKMLWDQKTNFCFVPNLAYNVDFCVFQFYSYIVCWVSG